MKENRSWGQPAATQPLFKYVTADVAGMMVGTLTARWSSPLIFDDPRDARCDWRDFFHLDGDLMEDALTVVRPLMESREKLPETMSIALRVGLCVARGVLPFTTIEKLLNGARLTLGPSLDSTRQALRADNERWVRVLEGTRIFCLTERNDSSAMWSKFAANHRGAVLRFSPTEDGIATVSEVRPVRYSAEPAVIADRRVWLRHALGIEPLDLSEIAEKIIYTKAIELVEEREWRCWRRAETAEGSRARYELFPFRASELTAIYLGGDMAEADRRTLLDTVTAQARHAEVWQARPLSDGGRIEFQRVR